MASSSEGESLLAKVLTWDVIAGTAIALSPLTSYLDTLISIHRKKSSAGFSLDVCAIMLVSSICKIYFYFGRPYELSLLIQSIIMIIVQIALLRAALIHRPKEGPMTGPLDGERERANSGSWTPSTSWKRRLAVLALGPLASRRASAASDGSRPYGFWKWQDEALYWAFLARFCIWLGLAHVLFGQMPLYIEGLGLVGLMVEAVLPLPQILTNASRGSADGVRPSLILSWIAGDISKLIYLKSANEVAVQFYLCTIIQMVLDAFVLVQYYMYSKGRWIGNQGQQKTANRQRALSLKAQGVTEHEE